MKKILTVFTTALVAATFAAGTVAYAEEAQTTVYPELASELTFSELSAFAVNDGGDRFAFAQGGYIYIFEGSQVTDGTYSGTLDNDGVNLYNYAYESAVTDLAFEEDSLIFCDGTNAYKIDGGKATQTEYTFDDSSFTAYGSIVYSVNGGSLTFWDGTNSGKLEDGVYTKVKICGGVLYAVKDNALCLVQGSTVTDISTKTLTFEYLDLTLGETIATGNAAEVLAGGQTGVSYVTLAAGTYVTNVDLDDLSGSYFNVGSLGTFAITEDTTYLYLGSAGSVYMLASGSDVYLAANSAALQAVTVESIAAYSYLNTAANVYSVPYMCDSTATGKIEADAKVTVSGTLAQDEILQCGFALVTYTAQDGTETTGYIASNFLTEYYFAAEDGEFGEAEYADDYSEEDVILAVCLVMVIVLLVILGVAFIGYSSGRGKRKDKDEDKN